MSKSLCLGNPTFHHNLVQEWAGATGSHQPILPSENQACISAGYEGEAVAEFFSKYLQYQDLNPSSIKVTDQTINEFVDYFLAQDTGRCCQSEEGTLPAPR